MRLNSELFKSPDSSYEGSRLHAEFVDRELGFRVEEIEFSLLERAKQQHPAGNHKTWGQILHEGNQTWVGLSHQTLQTPYSELLAICDILSPKAGELMVDLGAGYGRMGLVLDAFYPESLFLGFEYVVERVVEGTRIFEAYDCKKATLLQVDLTQDHFVLPTADYYFIYDYGTVADIRHTLEQLGEMSSDKIFKVIARGKGTRSLIEYEHPWLSQVHGPIHYEHFSVYSMSF